MFIWSVFRANIRLLNLIVCIKKLLFIYSLSQLFFFFFFYTIFVSSHMYPENPEGTQVIVGSMNMGYISDTARNRTHNLFRPKQEPILLGHSDGLFIFVFIIGCNIYNKKVSIAAFTAFTFKFTFTFTAFTPCSQLRQNSKLILFFLPNTHYA